MNCCLSIKMGDTCSLTPAASTARIETCEVLRSTGKLKHACICITSVVEKYCTRSFSGLIKWALKLLPIDETFLSNFKYEFFLETCLEFQQTPAASKAHCFNNLHIFHFTLSVLSLPKHLSPHAANPFWCWKHLESFDL